MCLIFLLIVFFEHYAHSGLATAGLAYVYNFMMVFGVNLMYSVAQRLDVLVEAERAYGL